MLSDSGKSFRRNPLIPVMWLSIGLLIAYLLHSLSESYETTLQRAQSESLVHARLVQGHAASTIERADLTLQSVIDHLHSEDMRAGMAISSERRQEIERTLIARQSRSRGVVSMSLTDAEGQVFANSVGATPGVSLASRNYFQALRKGPRTSPVISEAILGRVSNKWGVQVARRIEFPDGSFAGMLVANLGLTENFDAFYDALGVGKNYVISLRDAENRLISRHPRADDLLGKVVPSSGLSTAFQSNASEGVVEEISTIDGMRRIIAYQKLSDFPIYAVVAPTKEDVLYDWKIKRNLLVLFVLVTLAAAIYLTREVRRRDRAEQEVNRSSQLLREAISGIPEGFTIFDENDCLLLCNEAYLNFYAASRDLIVPGASFEDIVRQGAERGQYKAAIGRVEEWVQERVRQHQHADGSHLEQLLDDGRWLLVVEYRTDSGFIVGNRIDITQLKRAEAELEKHRQHLEELVRERTVELSVAKEIAEAASKAKSTFLANMSHELRTPMNAIMGMTSLMMRRAEDPKFKDQLAKVEQASQQLLQLISDILDISKIEAERLTLERVPFRLGEVLENLTSLIGHRAQEKKLLFQIDLAPRISAMRLLGDPLRLGQILLNFAGNAVKFTAQGSVVVRIGVVEESDCEAVLLFTVQDTGIGIHAEDQRRLFTAFEQADGSTTRKYGGTGLGLAISKRLALLMGGEVGVDSQLGVGSTFWLKVRLDKAPGESPLLTVGSVSIAEQRLRTDFPGVRLLLAEDEPINQEVSRGLLEEVGLWVDVADDGVQALRMASATCYDMILMDMQMPNMNGVDATRAIRLLPGYERTPIVAMTANAFEEDRRLCLDAGMNDHISKPIDPCRLFETIVKCLSQ